MGGIFCSYIFNNQVYRLRDAILKSKLEDIKSEFVISNCNSITTSNNEDIDPDIPDSISSKSSTKKQPILSASAVEIINETINTDGNTPLLFAITHGKIDSFRLLLNDLKADPNRPNIYTHYSPMHICSLIIASDKKKSSLSSQPSQASHSEVQRSQSIGNLASPPSSLKSSESISHSIHSRFRTIQLGRHRISKNSRVYQSDMFDLDYYGRVKKVGLSKINLVEMISLLARHGANLNSLAPVTKITHLPKLEAIAEVTPLLLAVYSANTIAVEQLIKLGCNYNYQESGLGKFFFIT
jgi:hypothetical protein